jgi:hypothetical protein
MVVCCMYIEAPAAIRAIQLFLFFLAVELEQDIKRKMQ